MVRNRNSAFLCVPVKDIEPTKGNEMNLRDIAKEVNKFFESFK